MTSKISSRMRAVKRSNTKPELVVRKLLHSLGLRFRLHVAGLPGTPDILLPKHRTVVFVHGCFWHRHPNCRYASTPKTNHDFWTLKFSANVQRDAKKEELLRSLGWRVLIVWECETKATDTLRRRLTEEFFKPDALEIAERGS
ncbi:very short patch repair endonuclease [Pseudomonas viridiflava]|uniref:very short patch repair endonuclease n=1 Tax=Pseudomonas viridiflava TaxID=33069 RepID=UPI000F0368D1|nr:very short patch repair endonuclease [Pseudomonas viridiflava]